ncbi:MAG: tagaturonate reductase [Clostridia bacterium]|nr:tagaturonate reductase [Clostridia bacterium]
MIKVIQFGEGGFLRGFCDWMFQKMNDKKLADISVTIVQPIEKGLTEILKSQNYEYTHLIRGSEGVEETKVSCIKDSVNPYADFEKYLSLAKDKDFKFVISNTTEAGIEFIETDSFSDAPPKAFPGKLTRLLFERFSAGLDGFVFLPCELIDKNGAKLKETVLRYAKLWDLGNEFISWINNKNVFCNTLVDRINTGYPKDEEEIVGGDKMFNTSEYFHLWVIEGNKEAVSDLPFEKCGLNVIITDNLEMYRTRKVRILNGAHTSMIPYALLEGVETVGECMKNEKISSFVKKCVYEEIIPTLDLPEEELKDYADNVFTRFENPYIKHLCSAISLNSVSKFKVRVLPSILEYVKRFNKMPENLCFSFSKLIEFYKKGTPDDNEDVMAFMKEKSVDEILANTAFWDTDLTFLKVEVEKWL